MKKMVVVRGITTKGGPVRSCTWFLPAKISETISFSLAPVYIVLRITIAISSKAAEQKKTDSIEAITLHMRDRGVILRGLSKLWPGGDKEYIRNKR